jgi:hypothetical protein
VNHLEQAPSRGGIEVDSDVLAPRAIAKVGLAVRMKGNDTKRHQVDNRLEPRLVLSLDRLQFGLPQSDRLRTDRFAAQVEVDEDGDFRNQHFWMKRFD